MEEVVDSYPAESLIGALGETCTRFENALRESPEAQKYLKGRNIADEAIAKFRIGYAPNQWNTLSSQQFYEQTGYSFDCLEQAGLIIKNDKGRYYDRFRDRITIPIVDPRGEKVLGFTARALSKSESIKYMNGPETKVYSKGKSLLGLNSAREEILKSGEAIMVEGAFDMIQLWQNGIRNVVAPCGTALTGHQLEMLEKLGESVKKIWVGDGDEAGFSNAERIATAYLDHDVWFGVMPEGIDPDNLVRQYGDSPFLSIVSSAMGGLEVLVRRKLGDSFLDNPTVLKKERVAEEKSSLLYQLEGAMKNAEDRKKGVYIAELSRIINLPEEAVREFYLGKEKQGYSVKHSEGRSIFWQSQLVRVLVSLAKKGRNQNSGLEHMIKNCEEFGVGKLLKMPEAFAAYQYLREHLKDLPLVQLGTDLFGNEAQKEVIDAVKKHSKKELDNELLISLFDETRITYPAGSKPRMSDIIFEDAIFELTLDEMRADLREKYRGRHVSLMGVRNLSEKIRRGEINGEKTK